MSSPRGCASRSSRAWPLVGAALAAACGALAHAERFSFEPASAGSGAFELARVGLASTQERADEGAVDREPSAEPQDAAAYGVADSIELEVSVGPAFDFDGTTLGVAGVGVHWFVADGVSFGALAEGIWYDDGTDEAFGGGAALVARWHFVRERDYSIFIEAGCGFAGFSDDVPSGGTDYDFTPRAALGFTYALDDGIRLVGRAGWFHISNGQTGPENPGFDSASISLGLSFTLGD